MATARCSDGVLPDLARTSAAGTASRQCFESSARATMVGCVSGAGAPEIPYFFCSGIMCETRKKKKAQIQRQIKLQSYGCAPTGRNSAGAPAPSSRHLDIEDYVQPLDEVFHEVLALCPT